MAAMMPRMASSRVRAGWLWVCSQSSARSKSASVSASRDRGRNRSGMPRYRVIARTTAVGATLFADGPVQIAVAQEIAQYL